MRRGWLLVTGAVLLSSIGLAAGAGTGTSKHARTPSALANLSALDQLDIEAGTLALKKGGTPEIRRFGDRLVRDHRVAQQLVEDDAHRLGLEIGSPDHEPGTQRRFLIRELESLSGSRFDDAFLSIMEQTNQQAVQLLTATRAGIADGGTRSLLAGLEPIVRQHEELATILQYRAAPKREGDKNGTSTQAQPGQR